MKKSFLDLKMGINPKILSAVKRHWVFLLFLSFHLVFFNINAAEWGDSYRILRASEFIRNFSYPLDEKRPPIFSLVLALRPGFVDQVFWGRVVMLLISVFSFLLFKKLCQLLFDKNKVDIALLAFTLNPVYFYWSIRVMADVLFSFIAMFAMYVYVKNTKAPKSSKIILLGLVSGLAILTRFEGYILALSIGISILLFSKKDSIKKALIYGISSLVLVLPWVVYRNPLKSSYFGETSGRTYDIKMVIIYLVSLLFIFGFTSAFSYFYINKKDLFGFFKNYPPLLIYMLLELTLILAWPAAIPRLFVAIIPFMIIALVRSFNGFEIENKIVPLLLLVVFVVSQYFLRLQFLVSIKPLFILVILIQVLLLFSKKRIFSQLLVYTSMLVWLVSSVYVHKDIFISVKNGAEFASENLSGLIGYNDVSSVSDWYLNQKGQNNVSGVFFNYSRKEQLECFSLHDRGYDYLLLTNEHNTDMDLDIESRHYLELVKEFSYFINGKVFFTKIVRVNSCEYLGYNP